MCPGERAVCKIDEDQVWQVFVGLDLQLAQGGDLVVAHDDLVAAFAEPEDGRLGEEGGGENPDHRL